MITLAIALASAPVLPWLDRRELDAAAKLEARRPAQIVPVRASTTPTRTPVRLASASPVKAPVRIAAAPAKASVRLASAPAKASVRLIAAPAQKAQVVRAAIPPREALVRDLKTVTNFCQATAKVEDQEAFFAAVSQAFDMSRAEAATLRDRCAVYLIGHRNGRASR